MSPQKGHNLDSYNISENIYDRFLQTDHTLNNPGMPLKEPHHKSYAMHEIMHIFRCFKLRFHKKKKKKK